MRVLVSVFLTFLFLTSAFVLPAGLHAKPEYFTTHCAGCHSNDTSTCNGCHHHGKAALAALADKEQYKCGETMAVTLSGGSRSGWIRALLFDHNGVEVVRVSGPTGTGDDSGADPVVFPVTLVTSAPTGIGVYEWEAAWWGSPFDTDNRVAYPHGPEIRVPIIVNVVGPSPVEESTWGRIKLLFR